MTDRLYDRQPKGSHLHTVYYEIDMLRHCYARFEELRARGGQADKNAYLEAYLLHYRNLVTFFAGNPKRNAKKDPVSKAPTDLSTLCPEIWGGRQLTAEEKLKIQQPAAELEDKYWDSISKYLQHCTTYRYEGAMSWDEKMMNHQIEAVVVEFETAFPRPVEAPFLERFGNIDGSSTASVTTDVIIGQPSGPVWVGAQPKDTTTKK